MTSTLKKFWGRALAVSAVSAASIALAGCSLLGGGAGQVEGDGDQTDVFAIEVGDCLNDSEAEGEVTSVPTVPCDEPHDSEAFASHLLADGDFPAQAAIDEEAETACLAEFEGYVGVPYEESTLAYSFYQPTALGWENGDRAILCILVEVNENNEAVKTTGSLKGSGK